MPGPIGATSGKFVLMGAVLLLHGRVDDRAVRVAIMPGAPASAISQQLADRLGHRAPADDLKIHLRAESFRARIDAVEPDIGADADLRIGQDALSEHPIEIDFGHREIQPLSQSEARAIERRSRPIMIRHEPDGTLSVEVKAGNRPAKTAQLDLSSDVGLASSDPDAEDMLQVGGVELHGVPITSGPKPVLGLSAFSHARVIFDLGHDRIWVRS